MKQQKEEIQVCNCCGRTLQQEHGICQEDFIRIVKKWGYFSAKDLQKHTVIVCETCYDEWIRGMMIPPHITEDTEPMLAE